MDHRVVTQNVLYQILGKGCTALISFATTLLIAKTLGVVGYGTFTKITGFVGLFYIVTDFGLNAFFLKQEPFKSAFRSLIALRLIFVLFIIAGIASVSLILPYNAFLNIGFSSFEKGGIMLFSLVLIGSALLYSSSAIFQRRNRYDLLTRSQAIAAIITLMLTVVAVYLHSIYGVLAAFVVGSAMGGVASMIWTQEKVFPLHIDTEFMKKLFVGSIPLGLMLLCNLIYFRIDVVLLSLYRPASDVGIYGIAYKAFDFLITLPLFLSNALYPTFLLNKNNYRTLIGIAYKYGFLSTISSLIVLVILWFLAPLFSLIREEFTQAIFPFRILLLSLPLFFITSLLQWVLITKNHLFYLLGVYFFSAILSIVLNSLFIPSGSYVAASIITGVTEAVVLILLLARVIQLKKKYPN